MQLRTINILISFQLFLPIFGLCQNFSLQVELKQAAGKRIYLAGHYLGSIYAKDSIMLDEEGRGIFTADSLLPQGLYKLFVNENQHFDFLLGPQQKLTLQNASFMPESLEVEGSEETQGFARYAGYLKNMQKQNARIRSQMTTASTEEKAYLLKQLNVLTDSLYSYWDKIEIEFPGSFLAKFIKANHVPVPDIATLPPEVQVNDSLLLVYRFYFQQKHFWDNFDYRDERFLYTPFFRQKLENWFTKVLIQHYDSVKHPVFDFIEEVKPYKRIFQFAVSYFLNSSIGSNIMGMDALFVDLAREYYFTGEAFWATDESLEKIKENVLFLENNLIGQTAPDLTLEGFDGEYYNLHQVDANYTLVLIYEPDCSHCKAFVPELYNEVYLPYRDKGLKVYAIYSMSDREEWNNFISEHMLHDWINVWDEHHVSRFKILYNGRTTPGLYVLDQNKKIIAKKITVDQIKSFMQYELR